MSDWWAAIEQELDQLSEGAPDPWAGADAPETALTDDQRRFLRSLAQQPDLRIGGISAASDDPVEADDPAGS